MLTATLVNNLTLRDFAALLPLTLPLCDYAGTGKISNLPRRPSTANAPAGYQLVVGDLAYYVPWSNLALFYQNFSYQEALTVAKVGKVLVRKERLF